MVETHGGNGLGISGKRPNGTHRNGGIGEANTTLVAKRISTKDTGERARNCRVQTMVAFVCGGRGSEQNCTE